jgi:tetratricopeptide (TPR) repeat protein
VLTLLMASLAAPAVTTVEPRTVHLQGLSVAEVLAIAGRLIEAGQFDEARALLDRLAADNVGGAERDFLDGMIALTRKDYPRAEALFRKILAGDPNLVRVRLELARTLFLMKKDEDADYHFKLAIAQHPPRTVISNIARFREAIRARRAWRVNIDFAIAPDSNVNSATSKERIDIFGLPFKLNADARARSGVGIIAGGDASLRLLRDNPVPLYLAAYARMTNYAGSDYDDIYAGGEAGPEFKATGGRLRVAATGFKRWYGGKTLSTSLGGRLNFDKVIGGKLGLEAALALRHDDYARRGDIDAWNVDAYLQANRALSGSTLGFGYLSIQRNIAHEPGYSYWSGRLGAGVLKEIVWGLRPQFNIEASRQVNDSPMPLFARTRRDWSLRALTSIYKRDWNIVGFAPSLKVSYTRNFSTISLYDQKRLRAELGITKAF